ncbi:uncharacterized protein J3D65DRAFT_352021 [Phyllosticta citribraziliensis]|uniref:Uncharacterized protein n=1 Tax=Phyllosticta citribraziliensis TaxID=989973 RepID=A0ABR1LUK3_9PEZI
MGCQSRAEQAATDVRKHQGAAYPSRQSCCCGAVPCCVWLVAIAPRAWAAGREGAPASQLPVPPTHHTIPDLTPPTTHYGYAQFPSSSGGRQPEGRAADGGKDSPACEHEKLVPKTRSATPHLSQRIPETRPISPWTMPDLKLERHEEVGKLCAPVSVLCCAVPSRCHLSGLSARPRPRRRHPGCRAVVHHPFAGLAASVITVGNCNASVYIVGLPRPQCSIISPDAHHLNRIHLLPLEPPR